MALLTLAHRVARRLLPSLGAVEQAEPVLWAALAPLAALPLAAARLGEGAVLLALAALLALLAVVREAANLATARAEADAERQRLERATQLQDELIHLVTHELKNPLTTVRAYAQLARKSLDDGRPERLPGQLANVDRGALALERLVDNLLQLSRMESSGDLPPAEPVDVPALAREVLADLGPLAEQKQLALSAELAAAVPPALAPPVLLREALSNLVSNAIEYTPQGGSVTVSAAAGGGAGGAASREWVCLAVADTGIGLSDADRARLFSRFFRSDNPSARNPNP